MRFLTQHFSRCSSRPSQNLPRVSSCRNARGGWQRGRAARSAALLALLAPYNKTSHVQGSVKANSEQPCFHTSRYTALAFSNGFLRVFSKQLTFSTQPHRGCSRGSSPPSLSCPCPQPSRSNKQLEDRLQSHAHNNFKAGHELSEGLHEH